MSKAGKSNLRRSLQRIFRAVDTAASTRQVELLALLTGKAVTAGITVEELRAYAFGPCEYRFNGLAGCVIQQRNRITGTLVGLYQAEQASMDASAGRWMTVCEEHNTCVSHSTLAFARSHLSDPTGWCEQCYENFS